MGIISCFGSYVFLQVSAETSRIPWCGTKLSTRYRSIDACYQPGEEGIERRPGLKLFALTLWKDINSSLPRIASLPLITLPHIITSSLAVSILSDLIPRLSHSDPTVKKKTVVTLYRLALVYPDTLRPAWPKIKDLLMDEQEDPSVTAAIINVVCELGWRRPQDFLPVAPRMFNILLEGGNNWMAIKILKLVCTSINLSSTLVPMSHSLQPSLCWNHDW